VESLTTRAERAALGAMISNPDHFARLAYLTADDFADPRHQAVYTGLARAIDAPDLATGGWHAAISTHAGPLVTGQLIDDLVGACPVVAHGAAYGALVVEASVQRQLARRGYQLADLGENWPRTTSAS
jgi:replicative DNA helicase